MAKKTRLVTAAVLLGMTAADMAIAQTRQPAPPTVVVSTPAYTETRVGGDQVVTFPGDELPGAGPSPYGDTVRRPPGVLGHGLVTPRLNFVSELLKSVEHL